MRRFGVLVSVIAVMLLGMLALHAQPVATAQEASPAAGGDGARRRDVRAHRLELRAGAAEPGRHDCGALSHPARCRAPPGGQ